MLAHFRSLRGPILMQHDFFSLMLISNQLSSISAFIANKRVHKLTLLPVCVYVCFFMSDFW